MNFFSYLCEGSVVKEEVILRPDHQCFVVDIDGLLELLEGQAHVAVVAQEHLVIGLILDGLTVVLLRLADLLHTEVAVAPVVEVAAPRRALDRAIVLCDGLFVVADSLVAVAQHEVELGVGLGLEDLFGFRDGLFESALVVEGLRDVEVVLELDLGGGLVVVDLGGRLVLGEDFVENVDEAYFAEILELVFLLVIHVRKGVLELLILLLECLDLGLPAFQNVDKFSIFGVLAFEHLVVQEDLHPGVEIPHNTVQVLAQLLLHFLAVQRKVEAKVAHVYLLVPVVDLVGLQGGVRGHLCLDCAVLVQIVHPVHWRLAGGPEESKLLTPETAVY